jgi:hypothetical protein
MAQTDADLDVLREQLQRSQKFVSWRKPTPFLGRTYVYRGPTYTNQVGGKSVTEKHYTILEIANMWGVSADLARDTFKDEPGVLVFERPGTRTKRTYSTMRVPESVLVAVHTRMSRR